MDTGSSHGSRARPSAGDDDPVRTSGPSLVINPRQDIGFVEACATAMESAPQAPSALQEALRSDYPQVTVRPRALSGERLRVWYVYRDGYWVSS